jgi:RNA-directed DNA polymerase
LGIPTIEDKILQESVRRVLTPIYEEEFKDFSFGVRKGYSAHKAVEYMFREVSFNGLHYIIDADIKNYFGRISHEQHREFLDLRVKDGVIRRMINKWLNRIGGRSVWNLVRYNRLVNEWIPLLKPKIYRSFQIAKPI